MYRFYLHACLCRRKLLPRAPELRRPLRQRHSHSLPEGVDVPRALPKFIILNIKLIIFNYTIHHLQYTIHHFQIQIRILAGAAPGDLDPTAKKQTQISRKTVEKRYMW